MKKSLKVFAYEGEDLQLIRNNMAKDLAQIHQVRHVELQMFTTSDGWTRVIAIVLL